MATRGPRYIWSRLLIAIPEIAYDIDIIEAAYMMGAMSAEEHAAFLKVERNARRAGKKVKKIRNAAAFQRLVVVADELVSIQTLNLMRRWGIITDPTLAHSLRLALRATRRVIAGTVAEETILQRLASVAGLGVSHEMVDLLRSLDNAKIDAIREAIYRRTGRRILSSEDAAAIRAMIEASIERAERLRGAIKGGRVVERAIREAKSAKGLVDALSIFAGHILSPEMIRAMILARVVTSAEGEVLLSLHALGWDAWRKGVKAWSYESWAARALMLSQGIISPEMITFLRTSRFISPELARLLYPAATAIRILTRAQIDALDPVKMARRYRVLPGEPPIRTFARATRATDDQILRLLAEAARDARREAERLARLRRFGAMTRAQQQNLVARAMHTEMRVLWENMGHLIIFGEKEAAQAAALSMNGLMSTYKDPAVARALSAAAQGGVDNYISRAEHMQALSERLYSNLRYSNQRIDKEINKALLRGQSAQEMAANMERFINPREAARQGGVKYAAMRLARTEINNAFHWTSIRHAREMPWVRGFKWNLSGSHPRPDECNDYADTDHDGLGRGIYKKDHVPGKPHPHCLCYVTPVVDKFGTFERGLASGKYDAYLKSKGRDFSSMSPGGSRQWWQTGATAKTAKAAGRMAGEALGARMVSGSPFKLRRPRHGKPVSFC